MRLALALAVCGVLLQGCEHVSSLPVIPDASSVSSGWTVLSAGTLNLNAVSGVSDTAVWVVGDQGSIQYWNGTQLVSESSGTKVTLRGVWAVDMNTVYAVGDGGTILSRQAGVWQAVGVGVTPQVLTAVWADSMRVVAVGSNGTVVVGAPAGYKVIPNGDAENLLGVTGTPGGVVTAVGSLGLVLQLNGTTLTRVPIPSFTKVLAGATTGPTATFFVGQQGSVYSSAAGGLQSLTGCPQTALRAASAIGSTTWIVGWDGTICSLTGASAVSYPYSDTRWFNGVYAASPTALWVVGASGTLLHGFPSSPAAGPGSPEGGIVAEGGAGDGGP